MLFNIVAGQDMVKSSNCITSMLLSVRIALVSIMLVLAVNKCADCSSSGSSSSISRVTSRLSIVYH